MKMNRSSLVSDIALLLFLLLCVVSIAFIAADPNRYMHNLIILNMAFLFVIVTYFTSLTAGLALNIAFLFGYGSFILFQTISRGESISFDTYFWLVFTPLLTVVVWLFVSSHRQLQEENERLNRQKQQLITLDEGTELRNTLAFQKDVGVFAGLSARYDIPLTLLVVKVKYWNEIRRFIPEEQLAEVIHDISHLSQASIRTNDTLYMLEKENATWGLLLFTDLEGSKIVTERIRQKLYEFNTGEAGSKHKVKLVLRIGAAQYQAETVQSPLDFMEQAKKQLEYDV